MSRHLIADVAGSPDAAMDPGHRADRPAMRSLAHPTVGIVIASHSAALAAGVCEVATQMAPDVALRAAGGTDDGGMGSSFNKILAAVRDADRGGGVVILYDMGSAKLSAELVVAMTDGTRLVDAPLVEGAIAAAVTAQSGASIDAVAREAAAAGQAERAAPEPPGAPARITRIVTLRNPHGLHARPAAQLARIAAEYRVAVRLGASTATSLIDVRSVLAIVALGLRGGCAVRLEVDGARADEAIEVIEAAIENGFGEPARAAEHRPAAHAEGRCLGASPGLAIGPIRRLRTAEPVVPETSGDPAVERAAFDAALAFVDGALAVETSELAQAHRSLLADPLLGESARAAIANGVAAAPAWWRAVQDARQLLAAAADELTAHRAIDVTDVGLRVLSRIAPEHARADLSETSSAIVIADDLGASIVEQLADAKVAGIALSRSGVTAHAVIVARGCGIPMLVQAGPLDHVADGTLAILDGDRGELIVAPAPDVVQQTRARQQAAATAQAAAIAAAHRPVIWHDGRKITIAANVASATEAQLARANGAEAIGLLRTELFYVNRAELPAEDEQVAQLVRVLRVFSDREVTIRTLDVGGDKAIPALALDPDLHGFLGLRGLRYSLAHPETLRVQLRAIMRAAAGWRGTLSVMAPMVTTIDEVLAFRAAIEAAAGSLTGERHRRPDHVGIMVETPASAIAFDTMAAHVDFASVGTNDLVQYVMAAERTNATVAGLYQPDHPAIWRVLEWLGRAAATTKLAVCGELAAHPAHARRLVELGVSELSMASSSIPSIKAALR